ncbi:hypothetical protein L596_018001 [Steinernema carpocapsae]|uniref:MATH domain-containing protein n=1 Tax=Steinernema carpocapsae TaxID=34508 RepID=A0A4U5N3R4_STECR|nr:hypothetical protein L596_018001 [Steinernema carpocapsae]
MASYTYIFKLSFATDDFTEERRTFTFQSQSINGFEWYIYVDKDREVDSKFNYGANDLTLNFKFDAYIKDSNNVLLSFDDKKLAANVSLPSGNMFDVYRCSCSFLEFSIGASILVCPI